MNDTVRLGRIAGIRVGLNWSLLAIVALIAGGLANNRFSVRAPGYSAAAYDIAGALTAVVLLVGVLLHEFGHALVARRFHLRVDGITLSWMGGVTRIDGDAARPGAEFLIAGIGPLVSLLFGGLLFLVRALLMTGSDSRLAASALGWLAGINVVLALFNLLPASPLDGGRVLHSIVWGVTGDRWRATRVASTAGVGLGGLLIAVGFIALVRTRDPINGLFISFIGWWLLGSARAERQMAQVRHSLDGVTLADIMRPVGAAPGWITVRAFADGYATGHPGWVWLLEKWDGGYSGVLLGDAIGAVPFPQWDLTRPQDVAVPVSSASSANPDEDALEAIRRTGGKEVLLVIDGGRTIGAVLPTDLEALVRAGPGGPVPSTGWTLTRG
jgi:Zn-dependent protease